ncbi:MAG TPA: amino acid adenylation domain-containing protein, partial [Longimicrobiaceae bacterium]|nr:amino acid adenylation domain-containing protein [Longimicrobiaceae bacterium]
MSGSPSPGLIHTLFEAQAARTPDAPALRHAGRVLTYRELDAEANRIAHHLRARGVDAEVPVGIFLRRSPRLVAALLGVLKAGGAYVPLDPAYPAARVGFMLADTDVPVLLTESLLVDLVPEEHLERVLLLDGEADAIAARPAEKPAERARPESLAYVIYTSGSTGTPKGVQIEHRSTVAILHWLRAAVSDEERGAALGSTSICFDVSIAEIFGTLCWGGTLLLVENALSLAGVTEEVRLASMVPSAASELLRLGGMPPSVRTLNLGGEPVPDALVRRIFALGTVERVLNLYGPTEDTTYSTCKLLRRAAPEAVNIGRAVGGTRVHVLDAALRPVPPGEVGEIFMAGAGVARGYGGRPALTAERFLPDPLSPLPGARMYRTGDLGRALPDGDLECLGRMDHQVKVRGFRVEPGEVEAALALHPAVRDAVVAAREDRPGETELAAYFTHDGEAPSVAELRDFLRQRLPDYMVPAAFVALERLPRTPNGKVDRLALPAPDEVGRGARAETYVAPRTQEEELLAALWAEVLGVERVGVRDDFFALGGHSLRATQVAARVREAFGVELPLAGVLELRTVEGLARVVAALAAGGGGGAEALRITPVSREGPLPVSAQQEAVWFLQQLSPGMRSYHFQAAVRIRGELDAPVLERALAEVVRRHEVYRTTFPAAADGVPVQVVHDPWPVALAPHDLRGAPEGELRRRMAEEVARPFRLDALPLVRWTLFRLADDEHLLLHVEHHLVHDGWSFGVLLRELVALYSAFLRGEPSPLPELPVQFADFAAWQRAWMDTPEAEAQLAYWRRKLAGAPPVLELPADRPRPAAMSFRGSSFRVQLSPELYRAAEAFGRRRGVTLYMTLSAAFQALLHRYTGEEDFCVGGGVAGRRLRETEEMIGMVVNTVPLRADLSGAPDFGALVERVRATALEAYAHQDVPFNEIVAAVHPERSRGHLPVYQVAFSFHHAPYPELRLPGAVLEVEEGLGNESAKFDLQVIVIPRAHQTTGDDGVWMIWEYAADLFDAATVERMVGHFEALLAGALAEPERRVAELPLLAPGEEWERLLAFSGAPTPYPRDDTLHARFAAQAARTPDAPAVESAGGVLTYRELNERANRLARHLCALGVGPEGRVGVSLERSAELVVAQLAVLKAGAAYVPLDRDYPAERLREMIRAAEVSAVVVAGATPEALAGFGGRVVSLEGDRAAIDAHPGGDPAGVFAAADSPAYIVFTSGSTGTPKGSVIPHRGVVRLASGADFLQLGPDDRVPQLSNTAFDAAAWEVWATLLNGACLVIVGREDAIHPPALAARIRERRLTAAFLTTALFNQTAAEAPGAFAPLRALLTGGEAADPRAFRAVLGAGAPGRLLNLYGPSECTTYSSWHPVASVADDAAGVPIGGPVANTRLHVLDAGLNPVPVGVAGELYVGGDGLARGYVGRPGLTAERFVPDPLSGRPGARLYRTGDRVRWRAEGALDFIGRVDQQVKIRGFR